LGSFHFAITFVLKKDKSKGEDEEEGKDGGLFDAEARGFAQ
jgi:hypothetical protein